MPDELKKVQRLSKESVEKTLAKFAGMDRTELKAIMDDPKTTMFELLIGSVVLKAFKHGDQNRINFLLDRTIGKVKEVKEIQLPVPTLIERPNGETIELGATLLEEADKDD